MISVGPNVYALYVLKTGASGSLNLHGARDELDAIDHLIRSYIGRTVYAVKDAIPLEQVKARIESVVRSALTHCDDDEQAPHDPVTCESETCEVCADMDGAP